MHPCVCRLLALPALLIVGTAAQAQAFRPPPMPRSLPGGGSHFPLPHYHPSGLGDSDSGRYCLIAVGALLLIAAGFLVGSSLGRWWRGAPVFPKVTVTAPGGWAGLPVIPNVTVTAPGAASQAVPPMQDFIIRPATSRAVPPMQDLILSPAEVTDKNLRTTRLLLSLAKTQPVFDPERGGFAVTSTRCSTAGSSAIPRRSGKA